tara:strand:- start:1478 stop:1693 length:216 start_codon:yes stop_codon:yes gene_type:complete
MKKLNPIDEYNEVMNMNLKQKRVFNQWSEIQKLKEENRNMRKELTSFKDILSKFIKKREKQNGKKFSQKTN